LVADRGDVWFAAAVGVIALVTLAIGLLSAELAVLFVVACGMLVLLVTVLGTSRGTLTLAIVLLVVVVVLPEDISLQYRVPLGGGGIFISDLLLGPLVAAWLASLLTRRTVTATRSPVTLPLALFMVWVMVAAFIGYQSGNEFKVVLQDLRSLFYYVLFFWVITSIADRRSILMVLKALAVCVVAGFAVGLLYTAMGKAQSTGFVAAGVSRFPGPNDAFLMGAILLAGWVALWPAGQRRPRVLWLLLSVAVVGLMLSFIRGYWVGFVVGLLYLAILVRTSQRVRLLAGVLIAGSLLAVATAALQPAVFASVISRALAVTAISDRNVQYRFLENQAVERQVRRQPLVGYGLGKTFVPDFQRYGIPLEPKTYIHNNYLWFLQRLGAVGLALFAWFMLAFIFPRGGLASYRSEDDPWLVGLVVGTRALMVALLFVSITSPQFNTMSDVAVISVLMGCAEVARRLLDEKAREEEAALASPPPAALEGPGGSEPGQAQLLP
jgi:O-antigen ligase